MLLTVDTTKLANAAVKIIGRYSGTTLLNDIADMQGAFGVKKDTPVPGSAEEQAQTLVATALADAFAHTIVIAPNLPADVNPDEARARVQDKMPGAITLDPETFRQPEQMPALAALRPALERTLAVCGVPESDFERYRRAFSENYLIALDGTQRRDRGAYDRLEDFFRPTVADEAARRARNWQRYRHELIADIRRPILNFPLKDPDAITLEQVFVPLRCWEVQRGETKAGGTQDYRVVGWLRHLINAWLRTQAPNDPFRLISGEMGCGKSSFCKMLAAELACAGRHVLVIPLHKIRHLGEDVGKCLGDFALQEDQLGHDPLAPDARGAYGSDNPLLLIFDGLDELSTGGGAVENQTRRFVANACDLIRTLNAGQRLRAQAIFAGRPLAAQEVHGFGEPGQRLHVLRYRYDPSREGGGDVPAIEDGTSAIRSSERGHRPASGPLIVPQDEKEPLRADQAELWWRSYHVAKRISVDGLPDRFKNRGKAFDDLLAQPLLNFLVAIVPEAETATSINGIYDRLFRELYDRDTGTGRHVHDAPHSDILRGVRYERFRETLEHIAMAAWHGGDRTVTHTEIDTFFDTVGRSDLRAAIAKVGAQLKTILNSFFVEARDRDRPDAYDFTHKSFREYLTASFVRRFMDEIAKNLNKRLGRETYDAERAAKDWLAATGAASWDMDLQSFFVAEIRAWQQTDEKGLLAAKNALRLVFDHVLTEGFPVLEKPLRSHLAMEYWVNAEMAFVAVLGACHKVFKLEEASGQATTVADDAEPAWASFPASFQGKQSDDNAETRIDASALPRLLTRLRGRSRHQEDILVWYAAGLLDGACTRATGQLIESAYGGHVIVANLHATGWDLRGAKLQNAKLQNAKLQNAKLLRANLRSADLWGANLERANLWGADLRGANLLRAYLVGAKLQGANLRDAKLQDANLRGAYLGGAHLERAYLEGANLRGAHLERAYLEGADLRGTDLRDAKLQDADLRGAILDNDDPADA